MTVPLIGWLIDCLLKTCIFCWLVNSWFINCKNVSITGYSEKKLLPSDFNYLLRTMSLFIGVLSIWGNMYNQKTIHSNLVR